MSPPSLFFFFQPTGGEFVMPGETFLRLTKFNLLSSKKLHPWVDSCGSIGRSAAAFIPAALSSCLGSHDYFLQAVINLRQHVGRTVHCQIGREKIWKSALLVAFMTSIRRKFTSVLAARLRLRFAVHIGNHSLLSSSSYRCSLFRVGRESFWMKFYSVVSQLLVCVFRIANLLA